MRIVIADNESLIRLDLKEMLVEAGHEVVAEAADGLQAIAAVEQHRPDLIKCEPHILDFSHELGEQTSQHI